MMIAAIEDGILAQLRQACESGAFPYEYRTLDSYPEDWSEYLKDKQGDVRSPGAWVVFAGWRRLDGGTKESPILELTFGLVVMAENIRGETQTRHGGPTPDKEPGSYRLAEDAALLLMGNDLGLPIGGFEMRSLRFVSRLEEFAKSKVSMLALEFATEVQLQAEDGDAGSDAFLTFHANWDIPPHGNVDGDAEQPGAQIPADASADATDHVPMETE